MTKEEYNSLGYEARDRYETAAVEFMSNPHSFWNLSLFCNYEGEGDSINKEAKAYIADSCGVSEDLVDFVIYERRRIPTWVYRILNDLPSNYKKKIDLLGFAEKKLGCKIRCSGCLHYNKDDEFCEKYEKWRSPDTHYLCFTTQDGRVYNKRFAR